MAFTNNRLDLFDGESYGEIQHANAFAKGLPNFVSQGLELTGNTLSSGIFNNTGTFGQLGSVNETHTITANYTGFIVIESTLSGRTSTSRIIESPTFLSTDPRTASNVRYFTIYELSNGSIMNDFRHIDYVKTFEVRNIGGSQFVFILNGFVSAPFDASVLAGNRTLINDKDINYDDSIHATTPLQDVLKDLFNKSQIIIGNDKPFELSFRISNEIGFNINLYNKIIIFVNEKYGNVLTTSEHLKFKMDVSTSNGYNDLLSRGCNKCYVWNSNYYLEWEFEYDNWSNVIVRDAAGYTTANYIEDELDKLNQLTTATPLYTGNATMNADIILNESIYNFARADIVYSDQLTYCGVSTGTNIVNGTYNAPWGENGIFMIAGASIISSDGLTLSKYGDNHSRNIVIRGGDINDVDTEGNIGSVYGLLRKHPLGTVWNVIREDDKFYRIGILNDEIREKVIISEQQYLEVLSSNKNN